MIKTKNNKKTLVHEDICTKDLLHQKNVEFTSQDGAKDVDLPSWRSSSSATMP
jgi:hypothetical protein